MNLDTLITRLEAATGADREIELAAQAMCDAEFGLGFYARKQMSDGWRETFRIYARALRAVKGKEPANV